MITEEMIDVAKNAISKARWGTSLDLINGAVDARGQIYQIYEQRYAAASLEAAYPLIRQQVLKEVNDALRSIDTTDISYPLVHQGIAHCQRVVVEMME